MSATHSLASLVPLSRERAKAVVVLLSVALLATATFWRVLELAVIWRLGEEQQLAMRVIGWAGVCV